MRNAEVIRQWKILKTIEAGRFVSSAKLAAAYGVTERTIRRDIEALQEAGFPIYDDRADGKKVWRVVEGYRQKLAQGFTLSELAALYFSKNMLSFLGGAPFGQDLESAFERIREALPAKSLPFLSRIQELFSARPDPWKDYSRKQDVIAGLIDAILHQRQARVAYYSFNSKRTKSYDLDPYRLVYYRGRPVPVRPRPRVRRGADLRGREGAEGRGARPGLRGAGRLQPVGVRPLGLRHLRGEGGDGRARLRRRDRRVRARAQLAREPEARRRRRRERAPRPGGGAQLRPQGLDQGLPAARPGGPPRLAARRDRARDRGRPGRVPAPGRERPGADVRPPGGARMETEWLDSRPSPTATRAATTRSSTPAPSSPRCARRRASPTSARSASPTSRIAGAWSSRASSSTCRPTAARGSSTRT